MVWRNAAERAPRTTDRRTYLDVPQTHAFSELCSAKRDCAMRPLHCTAGTAPPPPEPHCRHMRPPRTIACAYFERWPHRRWPQQGRGAQRSREPTKHAPCVRLSAPCFESLPTSTAGRQPCRLASYFCLLPSYVPTNLRACVHKHAPTLKRRATPVTVYRQCRQSPKPSQSPNDTGSTRVSSLMHHKGGRF